MGKSGDGVFTQYYGPHMGFAQNKERTRSAIMERMYVRILVELCSNRFKWRNLPESINERFLELELTRRALCVFYWDSEYDKYMALRASGAGPINMYDDPTHFYVTGNLMVNKNIPATECVPIWANYLRAPDWDIITIYAHKLAELDRTVEINSENMRKTRLIIADENTRNTMANVNRQISEGQTTIYGTPGLDPDAITSIDIGINPDTLPKLMAARSQIWNDCMTLLGINNANQDKRERVQAAEVDANNEQVDTFKNVALNARKQAAEQINKRFGLEIEVDFHSPEDEPPQFGSLQMEIEKMQKLLGAEGDGDSGDFYSATEESD